ncbi:type VI secretion system protein TssA [Paraburkholderia agricolaris]|uniref:type VI secretion system protein TssA n=1 Tax=Paraburkholderia agricolaris TaxID=2152888 RepID=UPI001291ED99|nr:type VI secretion system protein TssA [Paraburkholderia agricolaris]
MLTHAERIETPTSAIRAAGDALLPEQATAVEVRETEAFAILQAEMDKLVAMGASTSPDWSRVVASATKVLSEHGKDLAAAVWLVLAAFRTTELAGLADAVHTLRATVTIHWDSLTPPAARMRARANLIDWLLEQLDRQVGAAAQAGQLEPLDAAVHAALLEDWDELDRYWTERQTDGPAFFRVRRMLAGLPVQGAVDDLLNAPPGEDGGQSAVSVQPENAAKAPQGVERSSSLPRPAVNASTPTIIAPSMTPVDASAVGSEEDARRAAGQLMRGWGAFLIACITAMPALAFAYRLKRAAAWALIDTVPPAQQHITRIPPPADAVRTALASLIAGGNAAAIVQFCESRLDECPLWLDLNRYSAEALQQLGAGQAAAAVMCDTRAFGARLPSLAALQFADGMPFADPATQRWLAARAEEGSAGQAVAPADRADATLDATIGTARAQAMGGAFDEAMRTLEMLAQRQPAGRDRYRVRLAQCEMLEAHGARHAVRNVIGALTGEAQRRDLASWEPVLARRAIALAATAQAPVSRTEQQSWIAALAALDLEEAWRLSPHGA